MQAITSFIEKRKNLFFRVATLALPFVILMVMLAPTVFAQTTYVITDGNHVRVYTTYATDPADVLSQAGFQLGADDTYTSQPGNGVSEITVRRNQTIRINYAGQLIETSSYGETLEALLTRLNLAAMDELQVSLPLGTETYDGMEVVVNRLVQTTQSYTVDIPFETIYCYDPTLPEGDQIINVAGVTGQMLRTADVTYLNTSETNRTITAETITLAPVTQIVTVGTGEMVNMVGEHRQPAIGDGVIITADGEILRYSNSAQFRATAYTHTDEGCNMITATGTTVRVGTVAVDPTVIPYGTRMFIVSNDGKYVYGVSVAEDCGGAIKNDRLDLYFPTTEACFQFGIRDCTVYFLD